MAIKTIVINKGQRGNSVLNGVGAPSVTKGVNGDFYIDTDALVIYGPKASGVWGAGTPLGGGGGGSPGGANTNVQYNSSGSFAGNSDFTTDGAGNVTVSQALAANVFLVGSSIVPTVNHGASLGYVSTQEFLEVHALTGNFPTSVNTATVNANSLLIGNPGPLAGLFVLNTNGGGDGFSIKQGNGVGDPAFVFKFNGGVSTFQGTNGAFSTIGDLKMQAEGGDLLLGATTGSNIKMNDGSQGTVGHVWTQTNADGTGKWQPASGGGGSWWTQVVPYDTFAYGRDSTNSFDIPLFKTANSDRVQLGSSSFNTEIHAGAGFASIVSGGQVNFYTGNAQVNILPNGSGAPAVRWHDDDGNAYIGIKAPGVVNSPYILTLPADNLAGALTNDGAGNLNWVAGGGSAGGTDTQVQFNNGGAIAGSPYLLSGDGILASGLPGIKVFNDGSQETRLAIENADSGYQWQFVAGRSSFGVVPGTFGFILTGNGHVWDVDPTTRYMMLGLSSNSYQNYAPNSRLDLGGALTVRGVGEPALSPATTGVLYFDSSTNKFRVSENGGAYVDMLGGGSGPPFNVDVLINGSTSNPLRAFSAGSVSESYFGRAASVGESFVITYWPDAAPAYADLHIWGSTTNHLTLDTNGRVGIGQIPGDGKLNIGNTTTEGAIPAIAFRIPDSAGYGFDFTHDSQFSGDFIFSRYSAGVATESLRFKRDTAVINISAALTANGSVNTTGWNLVEGVQLHAENLLRVNDTGHMQKEFSKPAGGDPSFAILTQQQGQTIAMFTLNSSGNSGYAAIETGNAVGDSGHIGLTTGTAGGTRGTIFLNGAAINHSQRPSTAFVIENGDTASRPATPVLAQMYFDTDTNLPIWFDGTNWIDAAGNIV